MALHHSSQHTVAECYCHARFVTILLLRLLPGHASTLVWCTCLEADSDYFMVTAFSAYYSTCIMTASTSCLALDALVLLGVLRRLQHELLPCLQPQGRRVLSLTDLRQLLPAALCVSSYLVLQSHLLGLLVRRCPQRQGYSCNSCRVLLATGPTCLACSTTS